MTMNEYQKLAARTMNPALTKEQTLHHALFEMCSEVGEIHSIYQKSLQGHPISKVKLKEEIGDLLWGISELCTALDFYLSSVAKQNIEKLKKRYPNGFEAERSLHREET